MLEKHVEERLRETVRKKGGIAMKFTAPGRRAVPDRIVIMPGGKTADIFFVECKRPGAKPTPAQLREHARLRKLGCTVHVVDSYEAVDALFPSEDLWRCLL